MIRMLVLDNAYEQITDKTVQRLLGAIAELKIVGYNFKHKASVLPLDATDFVGTHLLVVDQKKDGSYDLLMGYKATTLKKCDEFNIEFPMSKIVNVAGTDECKKSFHAIIEQHRSLNHDISYDTAWTVNPKYLDDRDLVAMLREFTCTYLVHHHHEFKIPSWLTFGICKFKTDEYFIEMGGKEISVTPYLEHPLLNNTRARAVHCETKNYTSFALNLAEKHKSYWDNRIEMIPSKDAKEKKRAA